MRIATCLGSKIMYEFEANTINVLDVRYEKLLKVMTINFANVTNGFVR